jgi:tRNA dimethylallyltransferase
VIFLLGPTAVGKSRLAMTLAEQTGAEIASVDAFQVYRGLDVGTGKANKQEQATVRHHLIDLVEAEQDFSSADYGSEARRVLADLEERKAASIWVGGTGLYHRVMTQGLSKAPGTDRAVAENLEKKTTKELAEIVLEIDPAWAEKADLQNRRRVVRALAVWEQTGRRMSDWQKQDIGQGLMAEVETWCLVSPIKLLGEVIRKRVEGMLSGGWIEEVKGLMGRPGWEGSSGSRAIGYGEVAELIRGKIGREETCDKIVSATRAYAKRQLTWFRGIPKVRVIEIDPREPLPKAGVEMLVRALEGGAIPK